MLHSVFSDSDEDTASINVALDNFPTIAIFMSPQGQKSKKKKRNGKQLPKTYKSILDRDDTSCLAVVNFF